MVWPPQCIKFYASSPVAQIGRLQSCPFLSSILGWLWLAKYSSGDRPKRKLKLRRLGFRAHRAGRSAEWNPEISRIAQEKQKREHDRREKERKKKRKEKFKEEERLQLLYKDLHILQNFLCWCTQQEHGYEVIMLSPARRWKKRRNWLGSRRLSECRPQSEF